MLQGRHPELPELPSTIFRIGFASPKVTSQERNVPRFGPTQVPHCRLLPYSESVHMTREAVALSAVSPGYLAERRDRGQQTFFYFLSYSACAKDGAGFELSR